MLAATITPRMTCALCGRLQARSLIRHDHWAMMFRRIVLGTAP